MLCWPETLELVDGVLEKVGAHVNESSEGDPNPHAELFKNTSSCPPCPVGPVLAALDTKTM